MLKQLPFLLFVFMPFVNCVSQTDFFQQDFRFGFSYTNSVLGENNADLLSNLDQKSVPLPGIFLGYHVNASIHKKILLTLGLEYSLAGYDHQILGLRFPSDFNGTTSRISSKIMNHDIKLFGGLGYKLGHKWNAWEVNFSYAYVVTINQSINSKFKYGDGTEETVGDRVAKENFSNLLQRNSEIRGTLIVPWQKRKGGIFALNLDLFFNLKKEKVYLTNSTSQMYGIRAGLVYRIF